MNTNNLKRFAQAARLKLLDQIGAKLEKVLTSDSAELREKANQIKQLQEAINKSNKQQVIDTVAYTWFNRLVALRFMDVNGYEPIGIKVVSPANNATLPELLQEAKAGTAGSGTARLLSVTVQLSVSGPLSRGRQRRWAFIKEMCTGSNTWYVMARVMRESVKLQSAGDNSRPGSQCLKKVWLR